MCATQISYMNPKKSYRQKRQGILSTPTLKKNRDPRLWSKKNIFTALLGSEPWEHLAEYFVLGLKMQIDFEFFFSLPAIDLKTGVEKEQQRCKEAKDKNTMTQRSKVAGTRLETCARAGFGARRKTLFRRGPRHR